MQKPVITVVITDLDNTLFDWFSQWHQSFRAMLDSLVSASGVAEDVLLAEIQKVHQRHGTSEYAFLIEEIESLQKKFPGEDLIAKFDDAIHAYRKARNKYLRLYPGVMTTLKSLRKRGCLIVGYTESMAFYSNFRTQRLGLDGVLDYLYSPPDHDLPKDLTHDQIRKFPPEHYKLNQTIHRYTPKDELKPNPQLLLDIIDDIGGRPDQTLYVGDNLRKDVQMAQVVGVHDIHAAYGTAHKREEYELLVSVTHWPQEDVQKEQHIEATKVQPSVTLEHGLWELLDKFHFYPFSRAGSLLPELNIDKQVDIWRETVGVQKHFNDIEMKIRSIAVTFLGAVAGIVGFSIKENILITISGEQYSLAIVFLFAAVLIWVLMYFIDRHWYHRLLYGAVKAGIRMEQTLSQHGLEVSLTEEIGKESPIYVFGHKLRSTDKIDLVYYVVAAIIINLAIFLINVSYGFLMVVVFLLGGVILFIRTDRDEKHS